MLQQSFSPSDSKTESDTSTLDRVILANDLPTTVLESSKPSVANSLSPSSHTDSSLSISSSSSTRSDPSAHVDAAAISSGSYRPDFKRSNAKIFEEIDLEPANGIRPVSRAAAPRASSFRAVLLFLLVSSLLSVLASFLFSLSICGVAADSPFCVLHNFPSPLLLVNLGTGIFFNVFAFTALTISSYLLVGGINKFAWIGLCAGFSSVVICGFISLSYELVELVLHALFNSSGQRVSNLIGLVGKTFFAASVEEVFKFICGFAFISRLRANRFLSPSTSQSKSPVDFMKAVAIVALGAGLYFAIFENSLYYFNLTYFTINEMLQKGIKGEEDFNRFQTLLYQTAAQKASEVSFMRHLMTPICHALFSLIAYSGVVETHIANISRSDGYSSSYTLAKRTPSIIGRLTVASFAHFLYNFSLYVASGLIETADESLSLYRESARFLFNAIAFSSVFLFAFVIGRRTITRAIREQKYFQQEEKASVIDLQNIAVAVAPPVMNTTVVLNDADADDDATTVGENKDGNHFV